MSAPAWAIRAFETMQFKRLESGCVKVRRIHKIFRPLLDIQIGFGDEVTFASDAAHAEFKKNCQIVACGIEAHLEEEHEILGLVRDDLFGVRMRISEDLTGFKSGDCFGVQFDGDYDSKVQA